MDYKKQQFVHLYSVYINMYMKDAERERREGEREIVDLLTLL